MKNAAITLALLAMLAACAYTGAVSIERSQQYHNRAELVRCQNMDAGWVQACKNVNKANNHS